MSEINQVATALSHSFLSADHPDLSPSPYVERDVITSQLDPPGLMRIFPGVPKDPQEGKNPLIRPLTLRSDAIVSAAIVCPFLEASHNTQFQPRFREENIEADLLAAMQLVGARTLQSITTQLWESIDQVTSPLVDAHTGLPTPALDSLTLDCQDHSPASEEVRDRLIAASRHVRYRADSEILGPASWIIALHPLTWYDLASHWASPIWIPYPEKEGWDCPYCATSHKDNEWICVGHCGGSRDDKGYVCLYCGRTYPENKRICWDAASATGCGAIGDMPRVEDVDGLDRLLRDSRDISSWMIDQNKLIMDGFLYDVVTDVHIPRSQVYLLPTKILGSQHAWTREFRDQKLAMENWPNYLAPKDNMFWTDSGEYLWAWERVKWDTDIFIRTHQRIVPRVPQLAAKLVNIKSRDGYAYE